MAKKKKSAGFILAQALMKGLLKFLKPKKKRLPKGMKY